jgi:hypothetical protein
MLKNKIGNDMMNVGMDVPFHKEIESNHKVAVAKFEHSKKCKRNREIRNKRFNKVRVLYFNLMALLTGIVVVSVGRILYDVIRIAKM